MGAVTLLFRLLSRALNLAWDVVVLATPLVGVWLASSLLAYFGGARELALFGGALLFPGLPLLWELFGVRRFAKKRAAAQARGREPPRRFLTLSNRIVLRTLFVNGLFLGALLGAWPEVAFTALATRGDWFLDGERGERAEQARRVLVTLAGGLEWLHKLSNPNPYDQGEQDTGVPRGVTPLDETRPQERVAQQDDPPKQDKPRGREDDEATWTVGATFWPHKDEVHPAVASMPASAETSIAEVARYLKAREADPFQRVKALHDWVVTRLRYDEDSTRPGRRKPQDAASVFQSRLAVCEGYARLLVELGRHSGDRFVYVLGEVRERDGTLAPVGHAWNAVEVEGSWYLVDATWDDPILRDGTDAYQTDYLFIPSSVAIFDHFPEDPSWQLLSRPLSRAEFLRQPMAGPGLARAGLELVRPSAPLIEARGAFDVELENPRGLFMRVGLYAGDQRVQACEVEQQKGRVRAVCPLPAKGRFDALLFSNREAQGRYQSVASIGVLSR